MATKKPSSSSSSTRKIVQELPYTATLVGSIIEKGFSSSSSPTTKPPQPTVLPFPAPRHRSHGPSWGPAGSLEPELDEDVEEENDADYELVSSLANPIQRKKKKGLDFSRWREIVQNEGENLQTKKKSETKTAVKKAAAVAETNGRNLGEDGEYPQSKKMEPEISVENAVEEPVVEENTMTNGGGSRTLIATSSSSTELIVREKEFGKLTLMDEIESDNLARLSEMSVDEIAEAQAEIMKKMDPALLAMLKKRGRDKSGRKKGMGGENEGSKRTKTGASVGDWMSPGEGSNKSWKVWSERVEKARELRFTLDGTVVDAGVDQDRIDGNKVGSNQFNVGNVAERDFLRTEGNPAAVGYSIKEAVALIRSIVSSLKLHKHRVLK